MTDYKSFKSLEDVANDLILRKSKSSLLYAFNGSGKTRLSMVVKQILDGNRDKVEQEISIKDKKIFYYNAFTEDLFSWNNDLDQDEVRSLNINPDSKFVKYIIEEQGLDRNIINLFQDYLGIYPVGHVKRNHQQIIEPRFNDYTNVSFSKTYTDKNEDGTSTRITENDIKISKVDAEFLVNYTRLDFANIKKELEKLLLYCDDKKIITREDIELLATRSLEYDVFSLTNELFGKNYSKLRVVYNSLVLKKEEPIFLLSLISGQLRMYYKVKVLLNEHYSQKDIAKELGVHPYRVQLAAQGIRNYSVDKIMKTLILSADYDKLLKSSYMDKYIILDLFINKLIDELN